MDPDQQRIEEDLRGLLQGDVRCDDVFTQLYASDASIYELRPLGVVRPRIGRRRRGHRPLRRRKPLADSRPRRGHRPGRRIARPRPGARFLALLPPHRRRRGRPRPRAAGRRARLAESLPRPQRPAVRPRSRHATASPRWAASWRSTPAAATGRATARPAGTSKSCKSCWPMATVLRVGRHASQHANAQRRRRDDPIRPTSDLHELVSSVAGLIQRHARTSTITARRAS